MRKIKVVGLLVRQLQHGFTKNAKVSPNLTVTHRIRRNAAEQAYNTIPTICSMDTPRVVGLLLLIIIVFCTCDHYMIYYSLILILCGSFCIQ